MSLIKLDNDLDKFESIITKNEECPDLIVCYFTASWCGPCKQISPIVSNIAENNEHIRVLKIDVDECEEKKDLCTAVNTNSLLNYIPFIEKYNIHLIHISTDFIFDGQAGPYSEEDIPNPLSYYGLSKLKSYVNGLLISLL